MKELREILKTDRKKEPTQHEERSITIVKRNGGKVPLMQETRGLPSAQLGVLSC